MITWAVGILFGLPVYLSIGYLLGKITVKEFQDDTPPEELSFWGKVKRSLIFTCVGRNSTSWRERYEYRCRPFSWDDFGFISNGELNIQRYLRAISFIWPFKIFPFVVGLISSLFFLLSCVGEFTWNKLEEYVFSRINDSTDKSSFHDKSILRLKAFRDKEIQERKENLERDLAEHERQIQALEKVIQRWDGFIEKISDNNSQKKRSGAIQAKLLEEKEAMKKESAKIKGAIASILEKAKQLDINIEWLELYQESQKISKEKNIPLVKNLIEETLLAIDALISGINEASKIELDLMAKSGAEVEDMAEQYVEGKQRAAEFSQEKLEAMRKCAGALSSIRGRI